MMIMFTNLVFAAALTLASSSALAQDTVSGSPRVINGTTMVISGETVTLAHVRSPMPGTMCTWKNRPLDCGILAQAGLKDLTAGATVSCRKSASGGYVCRSDGFDLAFGMIHAGWAVPTKTAPKYYFSRQQRARKRNLALWAATNGKGTAIAVTLQTNLH